ncbi:MAG: LemA family protein [Gammaproteobacteria bacterium]|nr:LemA family protein [Gammaproteobacteria bacterium]MCZ6716872.1 LemA family protein [Gammaproteobacteria bacterium]MCZ6912679.1 LemA family protein [Pseudomonadota bacterium]
MISMVIFLAVVLVLLLYFTKIYNNLVSLRENVKKSWSNIDVLLKQRHDELPKLVETCKQYMQFEQETLERVMQARSAVASAREQGDVAGVGAAEGALRMGLGKLFAVVENYPELKADQGFEHLRQRITGIEESIADRREFYNDGVNLNNVRIAQIPDVIVANMFGFKGAELLEYSEAEIADVDMKELFE